MNKSGHSSAANGPLMTYALGDEKKKALAAALRENLKRRKAQARGRKAADDDTPASKAGAPTQTTPASGGASEPRDS
jgi:hypothetical protein